MALFQQTNYYQHFGLSFNASRDGILTYFNLRKEAIESQLAHNSISGRSRRTMNAELAEMESAINYAFKSDILRDKYDKRLLKRFGGDAESISKHANPSTCAEEGTLYFNCTVTALCRTFDEYDTSKDAHELRMSAKTTDPQFAQSLDIAPRLTERTFEKGDRAWISVSIWGGETGFRHVFVPIEKECAQQDANCCVNLLPRISLSEKVSINVSLVNRTKGISVYMAFHNMSLTNDGTLKTDVQQRIDDLFKNETDQDGIEQKKQSSKTINEVKLERCMLKLESLVGLDSVKKELTRFVDDARSRIKQREMGYSVGEVHLHMAFLGNPGTGKTTVAKLYAEMLDALGLVRGDKLTVASTTDLVAGYIGQTAKQTRELCEGARGGILFIDEAYQLHANGAGVNANSFNDDAVAELILQMEDHASEIAVVLAGYTEPMNNLFKYGNPGLRSRVGKVIEFEDYSIQALIEICKSILKEDDLCFTYESENKAAAALLKKQKNEGSAFGNAREARNISRQIATNRNARVGVDEQAIRDRTVHVEDVPLTF